MAEILKSLNVGASLATAIPSNNHKIGPDLTAGETLNPGDACYINPNTLVMRALESQINAAAAVTDIQNMTINGAPSGGTYELQYGSTNTSSGSAVTAPITAPIAFNANAATIQAALAAVAAIPAVTVSGNYPNFTFTANVAGVDLDQFIADPSLLTPPATAGAAPPTITINHTTIGQPAGTGSEGISSRVRGFCTIRTLAGQPVTLYDACIFGYSDQLLTPGADLFLSGVVPGGLSDVATLTAVQRPIAFAIDNTRVYVQANH